MRLERIDEQDKKEKAASEFQVRVYHDAGAETCSAGGHACVRRAA